MSSEKHVVPLESLQKASANGYIPFAIRDAAAEIRNPAATADDVWTALLGQKPAAWTLCQGCYDEVTAYMTKQTATASESEYDTFVSYAAEDTEFANQLVGGLIVRGLKVWYAPTKLKAGDRILAGIEDGLRRSRTGTLLITTAFLKKPWTDYELDILLRQAIEKKKQLLQVWHKVRKSQIEKRYMGLTGLLAIDATKKGLRSTIDSIATALTEFAPLRGATPPWESPRERFLTGKGEIQLHQRGGASISIFELLVNFERQYFPLALDGELFTRKDLARYVKYALENSPEAAYAWTDRIEKLLRVCAEEGIEIEL